MTFLLLLIAGVSGLGVNGRAVNISSAWFLPQEGFPVFYRYFGDKVTWNEAEAVCGFHHADLLSVQTGPQMDAIRAYLKEIDVADNIWIGLQKESPDKPFSWTNGEKLLGDGYWIEPVPKANEKLCAAIDPVSDFRWSSFYCRGPEVASFVCELPVPEWAKKEDGCMITSLPSLTITLVPEMGVVQLFSDCGLDGTRRIACKGGVNREEMIRRLSCDVDAFASTIFSKSTTDAVNGHPSTWAETNGKMNRVETTQTKSWESYSPQTRHRRNASLGLSSTVPPVQDPGKEETSTPAHSTPAHSTLAPSTPTPSTLAPSTPTPSTLAPSTPTPSTVVPSTQGRAFLNVPYIFPHSPHSPSERNSPNKKNMRRPGGLVTTTKSPPLEEESTQSAIIKLAPTVSAAPTSKAVTDANPELPAEPQVQGVPVLIITGEKQNDSATLASGTLTSENPQILLVIENKEDNEPYLIPLADDIILNNPSLTPVEFLNVDSVEVENFTTNATKKTPEELSRYQAMSTKVDTTAAAGTKTTEEAKQESQNAVEREERGEREEKEMAEAPQRPNRGRLLTHPNHPSFYPRFLNRVLG